MGTWRCLVVVVIGACGSAPQTEPPPPPCADTDADGYCVETDCNDADGDNWQSCATCADLDGDGYFLGCDAYATLTGPDCFDAPSVPASASIALSNLELASTMESVGVRATLATTLGDVTLSTRICQRLGDTRWAGTRMFPVGSTGVQIGSFFWLPGDTDFEVEVVARSASSSEQASLHGTVHTRSGVPPVAVGGTVFVSPTAGNDTNTGTASDPFRTIARAVTALGPGVDVIELLPGIYRERVALQVAGTATAYKVLRGQPGAIIDGANAAIQAGVTWAFDATNNTYSYGPLDLTALGSLRHVEMDDTRLYPYTTFTDLAGQTRPGVDGGFFYDPGAQLLHVRLPDDSSPESHVMHVPAHDVGVYVNRVGYWLVENLDVRHFNGTGIVVRGGTHVWVRGNSIDHSNHGIAAYQPFGLPAEMPSDLVVEDNTVRDTSIWGWGYLACKSTLCETTGILVACSARHVIRRNHVEGTFNGIGPTASGAEPVPTEIPTCGADGDTYDNTISKFTDDGLELDGSGVNQRIFRNRIEYRHVNSISLSPLTHGPTWILRNVSIGWSEAFIKLRTDNDVGWKVIAHNTAIADVAAPGFNFWPPQCYDGLFAHNNILEGRTYTLYHSKAITCAPNDAAFFRNVAFDGNLHWHRDQTAQLIRWGTSSYGSLQAFTVATGQEASGLEQQPVFEADGVTPAAGSVMRDRALPLPGINDRVTDGLPDIGAIEP